MALEPGPSAEAMCPPDGFEKDGICGHALAAMARFQREKDQPRRPLWLENQADTDITHVFLDLEADPTTDILSGTGTLDVASLVNGLSEFTLDLRSTMTVDAVTVNGQAAGYARPAHQIVIALDRAYNQGETFQVTVTYHGTPEDSGFGSFGFGTHNGAPVVYSLSEPYYANTWWPCKEAHTYVDDKFTLDMWVTVPDTMVVASNGLLQGTDVIPGSKKRYRWRETYPINVYLVSLTATNYTTWSNTYTYAGGSMPVNFYAYPESAASVMTQTANVVQMIATFSAPESYGQYPFINEKYGICQFPWGGGMEHQTITSQGAFVEYLNAHELSHQWWGDAVTCKSWHDIWLNEGFATFSEAVWFERKPGGSFTAYKNQMNTRRPSSSSWGGTVYCSDISSVNRIFDTNLSYRKGGWVVHMLRHVLGDGTFFEALAAYRAAYEGSSADTDQFKMAVEGVAGRDLDWFFNEWVYNGGAPYYRYGWQQAQIGSQTCVRLHVEQYQTTYPNFTMPIDITITTASGSRTHVIQQSADIQWYVLPADGPVTNVEFDKDVWILRGDGSNVPYKLPMDFDRDGDVDAVDFTTHLQPCLTGEAQSPPSGCEAADFDGDGDVDLDDFGLFQRCLSGPSAADPGCLR